MELGMIGLGKMGANMAQRLVRGGHRVVGFDPKPGARAAAEGFGAEPAASLEEMVELLESSAGPPEPPALAAIAARHGLEVDRESIPRLTEEYGLRWGPPTAS